PAARRERHDQPHETVGPGLRRLRRGGLRDGPADECRERGERERAAPGDHSLTLIFAALITGAHFSISALRCAPSASGVEPTTTTPIVSSLALIGGSARTATVSALILPMISAGVLAGMKKANQDDVS